MVGMAVVALVSSASSARQRDVVVYQTKKDLHESVKGSYTRGGGERENRTLS